MKQDSSGITYKNKLLQLFCRHKNSEWFTKKAKFYTISGEQQYKVCKDCGKVIDEFYMTYERY